MEISNIALRLLFNEWYLKNNGDPFAADATEFYGKTEIEKRAYYLKFLEDAKNLVVTLQVNDKMFNKYFIQFYWKNKGTKIALPKNCKTPDEAYQYGIEQAFKELAGA